MRERGGRGAEVTCNGGSVGKGREESKCSQCRGDAAGTQVTRMRVPLSSTAWSTRFLAYSRDGRPSERLRPVPRHKVGWPMPARGTLLLCLCVLISGGLPVSGQLQENCCIGDDLDCSTSSIEHQGQVRSSDSSLVGVAYCLGWSVVARLRH